MEQKDYSLLRPFNLADAKSGKPICNRYGELFHFVSRSISGNSNICEYASLMVGYFYDNDLLMAPLCWVEGKPVYKGDVLYWRVGSSSTRVAKFIAGDKMISDGTVIEGCSYLNDGSVYDDICAGCRPNILTWNSPKVKREGWINIYSGASHHGTIFRTMEEADAQSTPTRLACVRIEWCE